MNLNNLSKKSEAFDYFLIRARQLLKHNYGLVSVDITSYNGAVIAYFGKYNEEFKSTSHPSCEKFCSIYILEDYRGKGMFKTIYEDLCKINKNKLRIITSKQCDIDKFLIKKEYPHISVDLSFGFIEYKIVNQYYHNEVAKRSGVRLMNHIDEGLRIMMDCEASIDSMKAYCIHPIIQTEEDLSKFNFKGVSNRVMELAIEYKRVANAYLSDRKINSIKEIELSNVEVNDMLIADKIQNRKDFEYYHKGKHERSDELEEYFNNWFERLGINWELYIIEYNKIIF